MNHDEKDISGVSLTDLRVISDDRGAVLHMIRSDSSEFSHFGECYFSEIHPGVVKAWKKHHDQTQNLAVPVGRIRIVIFDNRVDSSSKDTLKVLELGRPDSYKRLRIPPGVWYGFSCISETSALIANCTDFPHDPNESELTPLNNPEIPYTWSSPQGV